MDDSRSSADNLAADSDILGYDYWVERADREIAYLEALRAHVQDQIHNLRTARAKHIETGDSRDLTKLIRFPDDGNSPI